MTSLYVRALESPDTNGTESLYRSLDGSPAFLTFDGNSTTDRATARYDLILDLPTEQADSTPSSHWLFVVGIDLEAGYEADFEDWYNVEHLPALAAVPGVIRATRFRRTTSDETLNAPAYLALYQIESPEIAGNPDWKSAVNTPWTERMRNHFQARWRGCYERDDTPGM